jgi:hypothetical protein
MRILRAAWAFIGIAWSAIGQALRIQKILALLGQWESVADWIRNLVSVLGSTLLMWWTWASVPPPVAAFMSIALLGIVILAWDKIWPTHIEDASPVRIEDYAVHDALSLKITNHSNIDNLTSSVLFLTRITRWNEEEKAYQIADSFRGLPHMVLMGNQVGLPRKVPRIFQLLEFTNPSSPIIRGKVIDEVRNLFCPKKASGV